ncbi:flagellar export protein FliJ [Sulfuriferula thiophila]|uniref:flagellar export protein FliJ n=1 Tax=Sulfuriferula thiophila TaxID=1781211 RepID=UPI000F60C7F9|nr:flagellar export protein FliJ [Sulfuriferula thiophila]
MANHSAIQTLIELASKEVDEFARRLGVAMRTHEDNEQKLTLLLQYREDYANRCQQDLSSGLSTQGYQNFRVFLNKLDDAIDGQREIIKHSQHHIEVERQAWQTAERKRMSFDTLAHRAQQQAQQQAVRREQKATDEYANRNSANKGHIYKHSIGHE